jgi:hypothetical protein
MSGRPTTADAVLCRRGGRAKEEHAVINHSAPDFDPLFVHEALREKLEYAQRERLARRARRTAPSRGPLLYPVRRRLGLQLISLGTALQGPAPQAKHRHHESLDTLLL